MFRAVVGACARIVARFYFCYYAAMRKLGAFFIATLCFACASCSRIMGYGVLLWGVPEQRLQDGDIVPVYIKSNISHVYVIDAGSGKIEVPLWQLTEPKSKRKAELLAAEYAEFRHQYARAAIDGLPVRADTANVAKQVYRLKKNEVIKLLYKGSGDAVMAGSRKLEGEWLRVLTADGTQGWCFSYNLRPFTMDARGIASTAEEEEGRDNTADLTLLLSKKWYPERYAEMLRSGSIDLQTLIPEHNLSFDAQTQQLSFTMPDIRETWDYKGAERTAENQYRLDGIPITLTVRGETAIVVRYTGRSGKPEDFILVPIEEDIEAAVSAEQNRRSGLWDAVYAAGPRFKSSSYGVIQFAPNGAFTWNNYRLLVPAIIASSAKKRGFVSIKYFPGRALMQEYDGVLTFQFDGMKNEVNFLYKIEDGGIRMEDTASNAVEEGRITKRALSPLVMFFGTER